MNPTGQTKKRRPEERIKRKEKQCMMVSAEVLKMKNPKQIIPDNGDKVHETEL